jgi:CheY-like chemotaxis protein
MTTQKLGRQQPTPLRVLIVDDSRDARTIYSTYLRHLGMSVETAINGAEGIEKAKSMKPDVVVMDISMPVLEGDDAAVMLKADPLTTHIPIVAITAYGFLGRIKARAAGFDAYCPKPCLPQDLANVVVHVGERARV